VLKDLLKTRTRIRGRTRTNDCSKDIRGKEEEGEDRLQNNSRMNLRIFSWTLFFYRSFFFDQTVSAVSSFPLFPCLVAIMLQGSRVIGQTQFTTSFLVRKDRGCGRKSKCDIKKENDPVKRQDLRRERTSSNEICFQINIRRREEKNKNREEGYNTILLFSSASASRVASFYTKIQLNLVFLYRNKSRGTKFWFSSYLRNFYVRHILFR